MFLASRDKDTICSVSTPSGIGGISVIRVSGSRATDILKKIARPLPDTILSHRVFLSNIYCDDNDNLSIIDEVCITPFLGEKSFTGEEVVEISCHGSPIICQQILTELCKHGARIAERGEFTYRAFLNGKMDLVQAESVLSVIHSKSELSAQLALRQLKGDLSRKISDVEQKLLWSLAHIEASIDFSTEDIEIIKDEVLLDKLLGAKAEIELLIKSFKSGKVIADGIQITLSGKPNTGKSSLMNIFLQQERSIISNIAGTTRDVIKDEFLYEGLRFVIADTAGIRGDSLDVIERIGIEKTFKEQKDAQVNLLLFDFFDNPTHFDVTQFDLLSGLDPFRCFIVLNKADLFFSMQNFTKFTQAWEDIKTARETFTLKDLSRTLSEFEPLAAFIEKLYNKLKVTISVTHESEIVNWICRRVIVCSSFEPSTRERILDAIKTLWVNDLNSIENISVSSSRQYECLIESATLIEKTILAIEGGVGQEYIAFDLKESLLSIQRILGVVYDDQILDKVFKEFCLGK